MGFPNTPPPFDCTKQNSSLLCPVSTGVKGLKGQIHLLLLHVQEKCELCLGTSSCSILTGKAARSAKSNNSRA